MNDRFIIPLVAVLVVLLIGVGVLYIKTPANPTQGIKRFSSYDELTNFIKSNTEMNSYYGGFGGEVMTTTAGVAKAQTASSTVSEGSSVPAAAPSASGGVSRDYSGTNIQVEGVDEADFVKNDGKYIYTISGNKIVIVDAYPADSAKIVSQIELSGTPQEMFINNDKLIVFGYGDYSYNKAMAIPDIGIMPPRYYSPKTFVNVYDITDRANPVLKRNVSIDGNYYDSRMIGDYVYLIVNDPVNYGGTNPIPMPVIQSGSVSKTIAASDVYYFDYPDTSYVFTNVISINTQNDNQEVNSKTFLMGYSENLYVSTSNIYVVYTKRLSEYDFYDRILDEAVIPAVSVQEQVKISAIRDSNVTKYEKMQQISKSLQDYVDSLGPENGAQVMKTIQDNYQKVQIEIAKEMEKTIIHKISINNGNIQYLTNGEVPGYTLNQFSMDEYNNNFRIATTTGSWGQNQLNNVYVLDSSLQIVGKLEDLAQGERIYSVRFLGEKGYLVTFRQIDPLFVIDLSSPTNPTVLGYLKIPGVSDYLHPYDDTHIIGVGNNATEQGRINGLKLSLFDVSDFANPKEVSTYVIGGTGVYASSDALYDHKAFLFSKDKNLMVIPVSINTYSMNWQQSNYWQGAYVFNIDLTNGIMLKGKITHENETANKTDYYYDYQSQIRRSLYMENILYTLSSKMIKMNDLSNLSEINKVELPIEQQIYPYPVKMVV
jgi:uncharacterized secreted protein with C-terminal beta-propeller domain